MFVAVGLAAAWAAPTRGAGGELPASPAYEKPFLAGGRVAVGGYMDLEFRADEGGSSFDQHHFVPFIYAAVSERVHVASELEFEHGGFVAGDEETDGEINVEFATVDITVTEALNFRSGVVLSPLGRLNVYHDAPMLDLTERPLVDREIIPSTLSESGMGLFGTVYPSEATTLHYEAYLVNGFGAGTVRDGTLDLRNGRGSRKQDNNSGRAFVGRLGFSPRLGSEVGVSVHTGDYDDAGRRNLTLAAVDAAYAHGALELAGEGAWARAEIAKEGVASESGAVASGVTAEAAVERDALRAAGFYLEARYHFLEGRLSGLPESAFTGVVRAGYVDRDTDRDGFDRERLTLGVNFRVTEETAIKNDLLIDRARAGGSTAWGDTRTGYRLSVATYF